MNVAEILKKENVILNHEGVEAFGMDAELELYTAVVTFALEDLYYEGSSDRMKRIQGLVDKVSPDFVAKLAVYARGEMHMRSMPLALLVMLAKVHHGDNLVPRAVASTVLRADEIAALLMCYQWLNPSIGVKKLGKLSRGIQNGLKQAFCRFDEYQFAKYNRMDQAVKLRDALFIVHPKAKDEAQQALFDKIALNALETPYTWETELSALGQQSFGSPQERAEAFRAKWEELIESRKLGYMALLRNLRNILEADVSDRHIADVCRRLSSAEQVWRSRQFPFRFLSAYIETSKIESAHTSSVLTALEKAAEASAANIAGFGADTSVMLACDVSGSMKSALSRNSSIQLHDVGLILAMLLQSRCSKVITGMFAESWQVVNLPRTGILSNTLSLRKRIGELGYATNGHLAVDHLIKNNIHVDKVLMFTDCQLWDSCSVGASLSKSWMKYKELYPDAKLYLFDLAGYGSTPIDTRKGDVTLISGWSDKVFDILEAAENGPQAISKIKGIEI